MSERFERFKKMAKDEFGLTVVESDSKTIEEQVEELWNKWNSTEVEYVDLDGVLKKSSYIKSYVKQFRMLYYRGIKR